MTRVTAAILLMIGVACASPSLAAAVAPIPTASSTTTSHGGGSGVGGICGGVAGAFCAPGLHCLFITGTDLCDELPFPDMSGICVACPSSSGPVCDCDGVVYENACAAVAAGVTIDIEACPVDVPATSPLGAAILAVVILVLGSFWLDRMRRHASH